LAMTAIGNDTVKERFMDRIGDVERRIEHALDRIGTAIDTVYSMADVNVLREALATQKDTSARLQENAGSLNGQIKALETRIQDIKASEQGARDELERLQASMEPLREEAANAGKLQEINRSMRLELDRLRSIREADRIELDGILEELRRHMGVKAGA